jgi:hypothetical protein
MKTLINDELKPNEFINLVLRGIIKPDSCGYGKRSDGREFLSIDFKEFKCTIHGYFKDDSRENIKWIKLRDTRNYPPYNEVENDLTIDNRQFSLIRGKCEDLGLLQHTSKPDLEKFEKISNNESDKTRDQLLNDNDPVIKKVRSKYNNGRNLLFVGVFVCMFVGYLFQNIFTVIGFPLIGLIVGRILLSNYASVLSTKYGIKVTKRFFWYDFHR